MQVSMRTGGAGGNRVTVGTTTGLELELELEEELEEEEEEEEVGRLLAMGT